MPTICVYHTICNADAKHLHTAHSHTHTGILINPSKCANIAHTPRATLVVGRQDGEWRAAKLIRPCDAAGISMIMAQNTAKHTQVITLDMQRTHTRAHIHYIVAGSSIAPATASACGRPLTAAATTAQVKPKAMGAGAGSRSKCSNGRQR